MFDIQDKEIKRFESDLKTFAKQAYPFATRNTLNSGAFKAQQFAKENIRGRMTTRNNFTEQSVRVEQERRELNVRRQQALVGSTADYMDEQEFGGTKTKTGKHGVAIPTSEASGEGPNAFPRRKIVRKPNKLSVMTLTRRRAGASRKQRNRVAIMEAISTKRRFVFLDLGRRSGIFRVLGGKKSPRLRKLWSVSKPSVVIPRNPWLAPAVKRVEPLMAGFYKKSLEFQLKRRGLFTSS
jgi:hypothetical protein